VADASEGPVVDAEDLATEDATKERAQND